MVRRLRDSSGFNVIEILVFVVGIAVVVLLLVPLVHGSSSSGSENMEAQTQLQAALSQASKALDSDYTGINSGEMSKKVPSFQWLDETPPASTHQITIGGASSSKVVVLCTQAKTEKYFCIKEEDGAKSYGESYSYYDAETAQLTAWPTS